MTHQRWWFLSPPCLGADGCYLSDLAKYEYECAVVLIHKSQLHLSVWNERVETDLMVLRDETEARNQQWQIKNCC